MGGDAVGVGGFGGGAVGAGGGQVAEDDDDFEEVESGCGCGVDPRNGDVRWLTLLALAMALVWRQRRRTCA